MNLSPALTSKRTGILEGRQNFPLCLAPMVGLSHACLRAVLREYLPEGAITIWPTEMLNSRRIPQETLGKTPETLRLEHDSELVPQLLGNEQEPIQKSILALEKWGAEGIDINMGCPVQKALKHNYGVSLMGDIGYAEQVAKFARQATQKPVSVKLRAGLQNDRAYLLEFAETLQRAGVDWITLHPRTAAQQRRGTADWSQISFLKSKLRIPIIGNGDIQTKEDVFQMLAETGSDAVMSGRALAARPWLLWQVGEALGFPPPPGRNGPAPQSSLEEGAEYGRMLLRWLHHAKLLFSNEDVILRKFRFFVRTTSVWLPFGQNVVSISTKGKTTEEVTRLLTEFFSQSIEMSPRTELRQ